MFFTSFSYFKLPILCIFYCTVNLKKHINIEFFLILEHLSLTRYTSLCLAMCLFSLQITHWTKVKMLIWLAFDNPHTPSWSRPWPPSGGPKTKTIAVVIFFCFTYSIILIYYKNNSKIKPIALFFLYLYLINYTHIL